MSVIELALHYRLIRLLFKPLLVELAIRSIQQRGGIIKFTGQRSKLFRKARLKSMLIELPLARLLFSSPSTLFLSDVCLRKNDILALNLFTLLTDIFYMAVSECKIEQNDLHNILLNCPNLNHLCLNATSCSDETCELLKGFEKLTILAAFDTSVTLRGVTAILADNPHCVVSWGNSMATNLVSRIGLVDGRSVLISDPVQKYPSPKVPESE